MPRQTQLSVVPDSPMLGVDTDLYYQVPNWAAIKAIRAKLTGADWMVWAYLQMLDPHGDRLKNIPNHEEISQIVGLCEKQVKRSMQKLERMGLIDSSNAKRNINRIESQIRDRLKAELGGLAEVKTPAGRIDLLTETQIIEVKRINDWKSALGQVLAYSAFYPEHQKRLHLFGDALDESKVADIGNSCLAFDVLVSFELVSSEAEEGV